MIFASLVRKKDNQKWDLRITPNSPPPPTKQMFFVTSSIFSFIFPISVEVVPLFLAWIISPFVLWICSRISFKNLALSVSPYFSFIFRLPSLLLFLLAVRLCSGLSPFKIQPVSAITPLTLPYPALAFNLCFS